MAPQECGVEPLGQEGQHEAAGAQQGQGAHQVPLASEPVQGDHEDEAGQRVDQGRQVKVEEDVARDLG